MSECVPPIGYAVMIESMPVTRSDCVTHEAPTRAEKPKKKPPARPPHGRPHEGRGIKEGRALNARPECITCVLNGAYYRLRLRR